MDFFNQHILFDLTYKKLFSKIDVHVYAYTLFEIRDKNIIVLASFWTPKKNPKNLLLENLAFAKKM